MRLALARDALGLELCNPVVIGPLRVQELRVGLPGVSFPVDLSGGLERFRNRRGELDRLRLVLTTADLSTWIAARVQSAYELSRPPEVWLDQQAVHIGLFARDRALAFALLWAPDAGQARWVLSQPRGYPILSSSAGAALRVLDALAEGWGVRRGRVLYATEPLRSLSRELLVAAGARMPSTEYLSFGPLSHAGNELCIELDRAPEQALISGPAFSALELAYSVAEADDRLACGDLDTARELYVEALSRAPGQRELSRAIAEIDASIEGRAEAALGMLFECGPLRQAGAVAGELLARSGELAAAKAVIAEQAQREVFAPLSALYYLRLAELSDTPEAKLKALDRAVAQAPTLSEVRWARFAEKLAASEVAAALSDAQHLEALQSGVKRRHAVCLRAAEAMAAAGFVKQAGQLFERALRYVPDDPKANLGLSRALFTARKRARALTLLARAVTLSEKQGSFDADAVLELAVEIATELKDLPQAIARAAQIPDGAPRSIEARYWEAHWRSEVGDQTGAALCFARMRDSIQKQSSAPEREKHYLREGARFLDESMDDPLSAEHFLSLALRLAPHDVEVQSHYRRVAARSVEAATVKSKATG